MSEIPRRYASQDDRNNSHPEEQSDEGSQHSHYSTILATPLGNLGLIFHHNKLRALEFVSTTLALKPPSDSTSKALAQQLASYFKNPSITLTLDIDPIGTPFQLKVWRALRGIPAGKPITYGDLAKQLQTSPRAIGQACRTNPLPIIIPCHRVVAANDLGGYFGETDGSKLEIKKWLLENEKRALATTPREIETS